MTVSLQEQKGRRLRRFARTCMICGGEARVLARAAPENSASTSSSSEPSGAHSATITRRWVSLERIYDHRTVHTTQTPSPDPHYGEDWTLMASYDLDTGERIGP